MTFQQTSGGVVIAVFICLGLVACGGGPNDSSSGNSCNKISVQGSAKGMINATINGVTFTGGIPTGLAFYTPLSAGPTTPPQDFIIFTGICGDNTSIQITARTLPGTINVGIGATEPTLSGGQPLVNNAILQLRSGGVAAGTWNTSFLGGSGSITLSSVSTISAAGSFNFTMVPAAGTPASGNRQVTGSFIVNF